MKITKLMALLSAVGLSFFVVATTQKSFGASTSDTTFSLVDGEISYLAKHKMHDTHAKSSKVKGKGLCTSTECEFLIALPVESFDSGNTNRDQHMQMITRSAKFPLLSFRLKTKPTLSDLTAKDLVPEVNFAGETGTIKIETLKANVTSDTLKIVAHGTFKLSDYKVEAPSLLGIAVDNDVEIDAGLNFKKQN